MNKIPMRTLQTLFLTLAAMTGSFSLMAMPEPDHFRSERGRMIVFPADSLDLSVMTFTVDGDTVSRDDFFKLDRRAIRTLTVTPAPANLIEVETFEAASRPLAPEDLPADIEYVVDGTAVDRAAFTAIPPKAVRSIAIVKGEHPRIEITTTAAPRRHRE